MQITTLTSVLPRGVVRIGEEAGLAAGIKRIAADHGVAQTTITTPSDAVAGSRAGIGHMHLRVTLAGDNHAVEQAARRVQGLPIDFTRIAR